ncbi:MAG TPA: DNA-3-methyladenine glycosylase [Ktedonobacterales bacterium]
MRAMLPHAFYARPTLEVAPDLLGKTLCRRTTAGIVRGIIVETEAYCSASDAAAHGYHGVTPRNAAMAGPPGRAYVYFTYGVHYCLNCVTEPAGTSAAVLLRSIQPTHGLALMRTRRPAGTRDRDLARGPGRLCQAFALTLADNGADLTGPDLWIEPTPDWPAEIAIAASPRIGISRAVELPGRFFVADSPWVSGPSVARRQSSRTTDTPAATTAKEASSTA